jgi:two-component system KDP operon response regulator KdpE
MPDSHSSNILIIDDVSTMRELYSRYLKKDGFVAVEAESGEEAVKLAEDSDFAGILLDLNMPGMHGVETCRRIRAIKRHKFTPILIVTSEDKTSSFIKAFEAGCDDFITKPVNSVVLGGRLKAHIQRAELHYKNEGMDEILRRYISPETQRMLDKYSVTGKTPPPEKRELCILLTDMRGVRQLAHEVDPEGLFQCLSEHLSKQAELVYQHGGYVDKYAGDGITAIF